MPVEALREVVVRAASGGGSGLAALLRYQQTPRCHRTVLVLADKTAAGGLQHGRGAGIKSIGVPLPMHVHEFNLNEVGNQIFTVGHEKSVRLDLQV